MSDHAMALGGTCSARFDPVRELFATKLESGEDLGASLAVNIDGETVVDLWGGWADEARTVPWTENTITCESLSHALRTAAFGHMTDGSLHDWRGQNRRKTMGPGYDSRGMTS